MALTQLQQQTNRLRGMLPRCGFKEDNWGHFQKDSTSTNRVTGEVTPVKIRIKLQATSVRVETKRPGYGEWFRVAGEYLRDVKYLEDDKGERVKIGGYSFKVVT